MIVPEKVLDAVRRHRLIPADGWLIVGVSGGADSLALLHVLVGLRERLSLRLQVVTIDHGVRGSASLEDTQFVAQICADWAVPVQVVSVRAKLKAGSNAGIEASLRRLRYRVFADVAGQIGASTVAVAHQADDQVETVLMHLLRGSGLRGLSGMPWRGPLPGHHERTLIRPLLGVTRAEIDAYCAEYGLQPRVDATNSDVTFLRNRLRHKALPFLRAINPQIDRALIQLADVAAVENDFMETQLAELTRRSYVGEALVTFDRTEFTALHLALQRRWVGWAAAQVGASDNVSYVHVIAAVDVALHGEQGARALLPGSVELRVNYELIVVERQGAPPAMPDLALMESGDQVDVIVNGITPINKTWALETSIKPLADAAGRVALKLGQSLTLRTRHQGDRFAPLGLNGHTQLISRWMVNRKIPVSIRDRIPLLEIDGSIAAIAHDNQWIVADNHRVVNDEPVLYLGWLRLRE